ncbi:MAG: DNA-processing protein DprA [Tannerellaceae bacterium]|jgi:DNA processing protein|nr:DNA-processing protein DprA [Tannerellaceae bacterium]
MNDKLFYQIALTIIDGIGNKLGRELLAKFGDAEAVFKTSPSALASVNGIGPIMARKIHSADVFKRAQQEVSFIEKENLTYCFISDDDYPIELKNCDDAPLMLYMKGNLSFEGKRPVSIVGTRNMTAYGRDITEKFIHDLAQQFPDLLIVSGLAYGVDIYAHQCALRENVSTVAVLAHGLDRIYPGAHRNVAIEMLENGGLLTEYMSGTNPDRPNFLVRNRIIAGLSKATVVIESAYKGGSLNTAVRARDYSKAVFAFPGRATDVYSQGCNRIITNDTARLISNANDFILAMLWDVNLKPQQPVQQSLSFDLEAEHGDVLEIFRKKEEINVDEVAVEFNIPLYKLRDSLSELELEGIIQPLPGNRYRLKKF